MQRGGAKGLEASESKEGAMASKKAFRGRTAEVRLNGSVRKVLDRAAGGMQVVFVLYLHFSGFIGNSQHS